MRTDRRRRTGRLRRRLEQRSTWAEKSRRERGVVVVWFALMLIVLLGFAGFAVDLSNWWFQAERLQRAADSGAHAGVVFLPGDLTKATTTARNEVAKNGYSTTGAAANATITVNQEPNPNRLRVKLTTEVPSYFVGLLGVDSVSLTREAVAEYVAPVPMGSPENKLGNDPENTDPGTQLWVNISAPRTAKEQGDRYQSQRCGARTFFACNSASPYVNPEYDTDGYFFGMDVTSIGSGSLRFQVYDAAWVHTGFTCEVARTMPNSSQITTLRAKFADAATRYGSVNSGLSGSALTAAQKFCTGDGHPGASGTAPDTTFIFRRPDNTPWNNTDNPLVPSCPPVTVPGYNALWQSNTTNQQNYVFNLLNGTTTGRVDPNDGVLTFAETFRRFATFCEIPAGSVETGEYIVQVRTNARAASPLVYDSTIVTQGHNKMSFRAGFGSTGPTSLNGSNVTVSALGRLPIFANASGADTRFFLAKVLPYDAGRTLRINLFDIGESDKQGSLQVLPPPEFASTFSGCAITRDDSASLSVNSGTCTLNSVGGSGNTFDGRMLTLDVPIPENYDCNDHLPTGCWVKIRASYPVGAVVNDATTWSAAILGNPVRLVE